MAAEALDSNTLRATPRNTLTPPDVGSVAMPQIICMARMSALSPSSSWRAARRFSLVHATEMTAGMDIRMSGTLCCMQLRKDSHDIKA